MSVPEARDFLFEIGCEELPAAACRSVADQLSGPSGHVSVAFNNAHIPLAAQSKIFVTPRRIAVFVENLPSRQEIPAVAERGPSESAAFDESGNPTKAAIGFAKSKGVVVDDLEIIEHQGKKYIGVIRQQEGRPAAEILPDICRKILKAIRFPKTMKWDGHGARFARPVRWLVCKYGDETIQFGAAGMTSGDTSWGHRFLAAEPEVSITSAGEYQRLMAEAKVIVDQKQRRRIILEELATQAARYNGSRFIDPAGELEEVIYLVENPSVQVGSFAEEHLRLPDLVLITAMQAHQRYFPLTDEQNALMPEFLYVINSDPACAPGITEGNERVLEGRIEDAEFSFDKDLGTGIEAMRRQLDRMVFHGRLGSLADKAARLEGLVRAFATMVGLADADRDTALRAATLAKADQVSVMVQEFPTLEGYIGSVYAEMEGYPSDVCAAVAEQYLPSSAEGELPRTIPGGVLSICDKIDNIMAAFCVNELPTGSRDPYGLRRAGVGLAEISSRFGFDYDLVELLATAHGLYIQQKADVIKDPALAQAAFDFVSERIQNRLVESGVPVEIVEAARASGIRSTLRMIGLVRALDLFRRRPEFEDLHTAYFRSNKIAAKAGADVEPGAVDEQLLAEPAERELLSALRELEPQIAEDAAGGDYEAALLKAAAIRKPVDRFFDDVLVMAEDEGVRRNRLALLLGVALMLRQLGDPMRVAAAPQ